MTTTVYLDESGDLGFDMSRGKTSRWFLVTALICSETKPVDKAVKKIFAGFTAHLAEHVETPPGVGLTVEIKHPNAEKGLQAVDMASWSLFRMYEHDDPSYADLIAGRLLATSSVFD
ncbi:MAG: DUF3800 domain-containing protein [Bifidobacteriaceae bacterium]|jgi:hypothetical protein|nr:DUF3800 domain-containing protein [Bifidobacteriaceae bacterium]